MTDEKERKIVFDQTKEKDGVPLNSIRLLLKALLKNRQLHEMAEKNSKLHTALEDLTHLMTGHIRHVETNSLNVSLRMWLEVPQDQLPVLNLAYTNPVLSAKAEIDWKITKTGFQLKISSEDEMFSAIIMDLPADLFIDCQKHFKFQFQMRPMH